MKNSNLMDIIKKGNVVIPLYLYQNYKKMNLDLEQFIFLMYLYNQGEKIVFNPVKIGNDLNLEIKEVMIHISNLSDKKLLNVEVLKNDKGIMDEVINLESFYSKLTLQMMDDVNNEDKSSNSTIFEIIEKEFGRTLSPIEYEIIKAWLDNNMSEELIKEAIKEATYNGVSNLRYIDKILYDWGKNGLKTKEDVEKNRKNYRKTKEETTNIDFDPDWNWFDEE